MGHEGQTQTRTRHPGQILQNLGLVAMPRHGVGLEALADLRHEHAHSGLAPGTADAGLGIRDQPAGIDQPRSSSGRKPRVTAVG